MTKWFNKWLYRMVQRGERDLMQNSVCEAPPSNSSLERMFGDCAPALVAFRIDNGYVMRVINTADKYGGITVGGYTYCKDHAAIAEHIITEAAKQRLALDPHAKKDAIMRQQSLSYGGSGSIASAAVQPGPSYNKSP
jgi:hypothetical protein